MHEVAIGSQELKPATPSTIVVPIGSTNAGSAGTVMSSGSVEFGLVNVESAEPAQEEIEAVVTNQCQFRRGIRLEIGIRLRI